MSFSTCPQCGLPRGTIEAETQRCPLCGWAPSNNDKAQPDAESHPLALEPDFPEAEVVGSASSRYLFYFALILVASGAGAAAGLLYSNATAGRDTAAHSPPAANTATLDEGHPSPADPKITLPVKRPPPINKPESGPQRPELAPRPRELVEKSRSLAGPKEGEVLVKGEIEEINLPEGEYVIDSLNDDTRRVLQGRVKVLKLGGISGKATVDASRLKAKRIIVNGSVRGEGVLKLFAPDGNVKFIGKVDGDGRVEINAPGGFVNFVEPTLRDKEGSKIDGKAKVMITAKTVELHGKVDGSTELAIQAPDGTVSFVERTEKGNEGAKIAGAAQVNIAAKELNFQGLLHGFAKIQITVSNQGKIRYREMDGAAKIYYRKSKPGDVKPLIEAGTIRGGAEVKRID